MHIALAAAGLIGYHHYANLRVSKTKGLEVVLGRGQPLQHSRQMGLYLKEAAALKTASKLFLHPLREESVTLGSIQSNIEH